MSFDYQIFFMDGMTVNEVITENEDNSFTIFYKRKFMWKQTVKGN